MGFRTLYSTAIVLLFSGCSLEGFGAAVDLLRMWLRYKIFPRTCMRLDQWLGLQIFILGLRGLLGLRAVVRYYAGPCSVCFLSCTV